MRFLLTTLLSMIITGIYSCSENLECEVLMAKTFSSRPSEFISGGCIDSKHAYLYPFSNPNVLMFASAGKDTFIVDSIIDFNNSFAKYANMEELKRATISQLDSIKSVNMNVEFWMRSFYELGYSPIGKYSLHYSKYPIVYRKKNNYQLIDEEGVYEISFKDKLTTKILDFKRESNFAGTGRFFRYYYTRNRVYFFPEYTKVAFYDEVQTYYRAGVGEFGVLSLFPPSIKIMHNEANLSYIILHDNREVTANIGTSSTQRCLSVRKPNSIEEGKEDQELEEIAIFGNDCGLGTFDLLEIPNP